MIIKKILFGATIILTVLACNDDNTTDTPSIKEEAARPSQESAPATTRHFRGALTGGMKGDSLFFDVSADGSKVENLTFKGYWYCDGTLERQHAAGPEGHFAIVNGKVDSHVSEPPNGGATAWRFDLMATINGAKASGTFRMNINALACNTGTLKWEAVSD